METIACIMEFLQQVDTKLFLFLNGLHTPFFDTFFDTISQPLVSLPVYLFVIYFLFKQFKPKQAALYLLFIVVFVGLSDFISVHCFKDVFLRYRPSHNLDLTSLVHIVKNYRGGTYGFVSSHAANTFAFALFSALLFQKKSLFYILLMWAFVVSYSRIYLGVHYPADICCGALLGCSISYIGYRVVKRFNLASQKFVE